MSDYVWEEAEAAFEAAEWTLKQLSLTLEGLPSRGVEFGVASEGVKHLLIEGIRTIRNNTYISRACELEHDEDLEEYAVELNTNMKEEGLKIVDGVHYLKDAYTGHGGSSFEYLVALAPEHLTWEELLEQVENQVPSGMALIKEKYLVQDRAIEIDGDDAYKFLIYNPRMNLMNKATLHREKRGRVDIEVTWGGLNAGNRGHIRVTTDETYIASFSHFSDMIDRFAKLPEVFTQESLTYIGFYRRFGG